MFRALLENELKRKNLSFREAAKEIGISHTTLIAAATGKPVDVAPLQKICTWLQIPLSAAVDDQADPTYALVIKLLREMPELTTVFQNAAKAVQEGKLTPDDFQTIADYASYILAKRMSKIDENPEHAVAEKSPDRVRQTE